MINQSHKLSGPFLIDLKNRFRQIAGSDNKIDRKEFKNGLLIDNDQIKNRIFDIFDTDQNMIQPPHNFVLIKFLGVFLNEKVFVYHLNYYVLIFLSIF